MNIGFITTSRADFGIYLPLLKKIDNEDNLDYSLFVAGMHLMPKFGNSWKLIENEGIKITEKLSPLGEDSATGISNSMGEITKSFGNVWEKYKDKLDFIFVLGDRYEMFAATASIIPFNIPIAHLHGGEVTLGAIDNKFRNAITMLSDFHFTSNEEHSFNVNQFTSTKENTFNVGSLGVEAALNANLISEKEFEQKFSVNIKEGFVLTTYHPETISLNNRENIQKLIEAFKSISLKVLYTLPNADTDGDILREEILNYEKENPDKIICFENLGQLGYYSAMNYCSLMIGNTSSGIIEAGAFNKSVINIGDRQKGRASGKNVIHTPIEKEDILSTFNTISNKETTTFENPYGKGNASKKIIQILQTMIKKNIHS
jgi:GDP/UDP-N,N'-diacetylbacillosamine 2-epimerase (hydrolysing)